MKDDPPELDPEDILRRGASYEGEPARSVTFKVVGGFRVHVDFDEYHIRYEATEAGQMRGEHRLGQLFAAAFREHPDAMRVEVTFHFDPPAKPPVGG